MTKRSSFVMPPVLTSVAANVDILDRSPKSLMQSSPDAPNWAGLKLQASVHGNIAVKPPPIRLLALCTAMPRSPRFDLPENASGTGVLRRTNRAINRFAA
jgi:hypothetical protein